jgi:hypothetical protein
LRLADLYADDRGEPFADVVGGQVRIGILERAALARVGVDRPGKGRPEACEVSAAVDRVDVVGERVDLLGERVVVLERDLGDGVVLEGPFDVDGFRVQVLMRPI